MDRDNRWDRVELAYRALTQGEGEDGGEDPTTAVQASYDDGKTDEFVVPHGDEKNGQPMAVIKDDDSIIFYNFRPDRAREITRASVTTSSRALTEERVWTYLCLLYGL